MKEAVLRFALRAAGQSGVAFNELRRWLSPWGWSSVGLAPVLRSMREEGIAVLEEGADGAILAVALTPDGERALAAYGTSGGPAPVPAPAEGGTTQAAGPLNPGR